MHFHVKLPYTWSLHRAIMASYSHVPPASMYLSETDIWYQGPLDCITILCAHINSYNSRKSFKVMLRKCIDQKVMWVYIHHEMITFFIYKLGAVLYLEPDALGLRGVVYLCSISHSRQHKAASEPVAGDWCLSMSARIRILHSSSQLFVSYSNVYACPCASAYLPKNVKWQKKTPKSIKIPPIHGRIHASPNLNILNLTDTLGPISI